MEKNITPQNHRYLEIRAILKEIYITSRRITHKELKLEELKLVNQINKEDTDPMVILKMDISIKKDKTVLEHLKNKLEVLQSSTIIEGYMSPTEVLAVLEKDKKTYLKN